jgi:hypothetical protein
VIGLFVILNLSRFVSAARGASPASVMRERCGAIGVGSRRFQTHALNDTAKRCRWRTLWIGHFRNQSHQEAQARLDRGRAISL